MVLETQDIVEVDNNEATDVSVGVAELVKVSSADLKIAEFKAMAAGLKVRDTKDTKGLKKVNETRLTVKRERVALTKHVKEVKAPIQAFLNKYNAEFNRVEGEFKAIESDLQREEDRIAELKQQEEDAMLQSRIDELAKYEVVITIADARKYNKTTYAAALQQAKDDYIKALEQRAAEAARLAKEAEIKAKEELVISVPDVHTQIEADPPVPEEPEPALAPKVEPEKAAEEPTGHISDKERIEAYKKALMDVECPEVESDHAQRIMFQVKNLMGKVCAYIDEKIQAL